MKLLDRVLSITKLYENKVIAVPQNPKIVKSIAEAESRYGSISNNQWPKESAWMKTLTIPDWASKNWINSATGKPTTRIYMNSDAHQPMLDALENLKKRGLLSELKTFDGCFNIRDVRGVPGMISTHAYGLAIDINAKENGLGKEPKLSKDFVQCFTDAGWTWGGNFKRKDGMHFEFAWN
jgi:hypothetical protein